MVAPTPRPSDEALADALEDYHARQALGQGADPTRYADLLGERFEEFLEVLRGEEALDRLLVEPGMPALPRPFGPYTLIRELGRGGVGVVYEAVERHLGRTLAVKILRSGLDTDPNIQERFRREARTCASVRHDHIVAIHASGEIDGQAYYAMDLVAGESLEQLLKAGRVPEQRLLARELANVADALHAIHAKDVIHRDVKPSNLMVRPDGRILLTDFGLARADGSLKVTHTGQILATPLYASLEQLLGKHDKVDVRSDVYGLGASLYAALTGRPPFQTDDIQELYRMALKERPARPRTLAPGIDPDLERIILRAIEKEPGDRYATAAEMAEQLRNFAEGRKVQGGPVSSLRHAARAVGRRWKPLAAAALLLVGAGVGFQAWWQDRDGTLALRFLPARAGASQARVVIDGAEVGSMPWRGAIAAGQHVGEVRLPGEEPIAIRDGDDPADARFTIRPGVEREIFVYGMPEPGTDGVSNIVKGAFPELAGVPSGTRSGFDSAPAVLLMPRGGVRLDDLDEWAVDIFPTDYVPNGRLVLRRGSEELWSESLVWNGPGSGHVVCGRFPLGLRARIRPGDVLAFAWEPPTPSPGARPEARPQSIDVRVLKDDPAAPLIGKIERQFAAAPARLRALLRARALATAGLIPAAIQQIRPQIRDVSLDRVALEELLRVLKQTGTVSELESEIEAFLAGTGPAPTLCAPPR